MGKKFGLMKALYLPPDAPVSDEQLRQMRELMPCFFCNGTPAPNRVVWVPFGKEQDALVLSLVVSGTAPPPENHIRYLTLMLCGPCWEPYSGLEKEKMTELAERVKGKFMRGEAC